MPVKRQDIFKYSNMEILGFYLYRLSPIFDGYYFLKLDDDKKISLILDTINETRSTYDYSDEYARFLISSLRKKLGSLTKDAFSIPSEKYNIINEYFSNQTFNEKRKLYSVLGYLVKFLNRFEIKHDEEFIGNMLDNCPNAKLFMINFIKNYEVILANVSPDTLFNSKFIADCIKQTVNKGYYNIDHKYYNEGLSQYLEEVLKGKKISESEEANLMLRVKENDLEARKKVISSSLRYIVFLASSFNNKLFNKSSESLLDLIEEGTLGLMKAFKNYDYGENNSFSKYSSFYIFSQIRRYLTKFSLPVSMSEKNKSKVVYYRKVYNELKGELRREPTVLELADSAGADIKTIEFYMPAIMDFQSVEDIIDLEYYNEANYSYDKDLDENIFSAQLISRVNDYINNFAFDERERFILNHRFGLNGHSIMTLDEIGNRLNVTRERVRQIEKILIKKLGGQRFSLADLCQGHDEEEELARYIESLNKAKEAEELSKSNKKNTRKKREKTKKVKEEKKTEEKVVEEEDIIIPGNVYDYFKDSSSDLEVSKNNIDQILHKDIIYNGEEITKINLPEKLPIRDFVNISPEAFKKALSLLENPTYRYIFHGLNLMEALIIIFRYGFIDNIRYSIKVISGFFMITEDELRYIKEYAIAKSKLMLNDNNVLVPENKNFCKILSK